MKRFLTVFCIVSVLLGSIFAYVQLGPIRTILGIQKSFHEGDVESLNDSINFESVRASLKVQVRDQIDGRNFFEAESPLLQTLYSSFSYSLMDSMVDEYLKPETLHSLFDLSEDENDALTGEENRAESFTDEGEGQNWMAIALEYQALCDFEYSSWDTFEVKIKETVTEPVSFALFAGTRVSFQRSGMDWKVCDIIFPKSFFQASLDKAGLN
jgi:hypothetical protein